MGFTGFPIGGQVSASRMGGPGLVHLSTVSFSAASTVSLDGCFTANHTNYLIMMDGTQSADGFVLMRLRVAGADASGSNYTNVYQLANGASNTSGTESGTSWGVAYGAATRWSSQLNLYGPAVSAATTFIASYGQIGDYMMDKMGDHSLTTAYDGFSLIASTGTITGAVSVYGYHKA